MPDDGKLYFYDMAVRNDWAKLMRGMGYEVRRYVSVRGYGGTEKSKAYALAFNKTRQWNEG